MKKKFSWFEIFRLGIVQMAIGGMVVITTSTLNRIMVVELLLPAVVPGLLVTLHYCIQILRPRMGFGVDKSGVATPWIGGGLLILALGSATTSYATLLMFENQVNGLVIATIGFILIGLGVSASGTSLLTLLAKKVDENKRAPAAAVLWLMMIGGFVVCSSVTLVLLLMAFVAIWDIEKPEESRNEDADQVTSTDFFSALSEIWIEKETRLFSIFVFMSMFAFSMQDLILEPFAGTVFDMTPGETTKLSGMQHLGVLLGMVFISIICSGFFIFKKISSLKLWISLGCFLSAFSLLLLSFIALGKTSFPLRETVILLGVSNGIFSIAAIGLMMQLARQGLKKREGIRMGLWGAAQAIAFALGGLMGTIFSDLFRYFFSSDREGYATVFLIESGLFLIAMAISFGLYSKKHKAEKKILDLKKETKTLCTN
jgi:BCD family chlorophyll transporter-like MFS transporter